MVGSIPRDKSHDRGQTAVMRQVTGWGAAGELKEVIRLVTLGSFQGADKGPVQHSIVTPLICFNYLHYSL